MGRRASLPDDGECTRLGRLPIAIAGRDTQDVLTERERAQAAALPALARVVAFAARMPGDGWIVGGGWDEGAWAKRYPTWDALNEQFPERPVYLRSLHGFGGWANKAAFAKAKADLEKEMQENPELKELSRNLMVDITSEGLRIQLVDQDNKPLFPIGSAEMYDYTKKIVAVVARTVNSLPNDISVRAPL